MLKGQPVSLVLTVNAFLCALWHYAVYFLCVIKKSRSFSPERKLYKPRKWERDGRFYYDVLKINRWKDLLPQHTGKNGFSKDHLDDVSIEYIDRFIMETCRGEWDHKMNCLFVIVLLSINDLFWGALISVLLIAGNLPFILIQRYNRMRLQRLRALILKKAEKQALKNHQKSIQRTEL